MGLTDTRLTWYYHYMNIQQTQNRPQPSEGVINTDQPIDVEKEIYTLLLNSVLNVAGENYDSMDYHVFCEVAGENTKKIMQLIHKENS